MSEKKKILIVGGTGFVGANLARELAKTHEVTSTHRSHFTALPGIHYVPFNALHEKDRCMALVQRVEPDVVIYAVGSNDPVKAEKETNATQIAHSTGANHMLVASDYLKAKYIYLSSDWVFMGTDGNYAEGDTAIPTYALGKAKLGAENYIRSRSLNHIIIRCAPLLGRGTLEHPSWLDQVREDALLGRLKPLSGRTLHNPVHIRELSTLIRRVIENDLRNKTLHTGGLTKVSLFDLAKKFLKTLSVDLKTEVALAANEGSGPKEDFSLNFTQTLKSVQTEPLLLQQSLDLLK